MPLYLELGESQLKELELFIRLGNDRIRKISDAISKIPALIPKTKEVAKTIQEIISDDAIEADIIMQQMMALCSLKRRTNLTAKEVFDSLLYSIKNTEFVWEEKKIKEFERLGPELIELLSQPKALYMLKAQILPLDYTNLSRSFKIITDIRPIFNEDGDGIVGAFVNYTLRLYYTTSGGHKSLSIVLDTEDVENLRKTCSRALKKAETAKNILNERPNIEIKKR